MPRLASRLALSGVLALSLAGPARPDDAPIPRREIEYRVDQAIYRAIADGIPLYQQRDFAGCYRLYQGTLIGLDPILEHRPELRQAIEKGLKDAAEAKSEAQKALELRKVLDALLDALRRPAPAVSIPGK